MVATRSDQTVTQCSVLVTPEIYWPFGSCREQILKTIHEHIRVGVLLRQRVIKYKYKPYSC